MVANLHQNPQRRPVVGVKLPTLLRQGIMWLLLNPNSPAGTQTQTGSEDALAADSATAASSSATTTPLTEERWMLPEDMKFHRAPCTAPALHCLSCLFVCLFVQFRSSFGLGIGNCITNIA